MQMFTRLKAARVAYFRRHRAALVCLQEEYQDTKTLEPRLQHVARGLVRQQQPGATKAQQAAAAAVRQQAQLNAQQQAAMQQQQQAMAVSNGFAPGAMQPGFAMQQQGMAMQQQQQSGAFPPGTAPQMVRAPGVGMQPGNPTTQQQQYALQQQHPGGVPGSAAAGAIGQQQAAGGYRVPQAGATQGSMPSPADPTGATGNAFAAQQQAQQQVMQQQQALLRSQQQAAAAAMPGGVGAPVMSNGAPVLLRNQAPREWNPAGNGAMVRRYCLRMQRSRACHERMGLIAERRSCS